MRRVARIAVLLLLAMTARAGAGIPLSTVAELRAVSCCASSACMNVVRISHCSCCHVANPDDIPLKQVTPSSHPGAVGLPMQAVDVRCHAPITSFGAVTADATGPPTYLRLRTLQC